MEKIVAVTFDVADQKCTTYNGMEWHNFIADAREEVQEPTASLEDLFDELFGDEFWFELVDRSFYAVAFDLCSEEFVICENERQVDSYNAMAEDGEYTEEVFWAE